MGFPVIVEVRAPVTASLTGKATINALSMAPSVTSTERSSSPPSTPDLSEPLFHSPLSTLPPVLTSTPSSTSQKLSIMIEPVTHEPTALAHYHILPYTTVGQINKLQPITMTPAIKAIKAIPERKVLESTFGEYLGLGLKTKLVTESRFD